MKFNRILGLHGFSSHSLREMHDAGVCIVEDGEVLAALDEERLSRDKRDGSFPHASYREVLEMTGLQPTDIDAVAFVDRRSPWQTVHVFRYTLDAYLQTNAKPWSYLQFWTKTILNSKRLPPRGLESVKTAFLEHHQCHAASAYYTSPWVEATVVSLDGMGDFSIGGCVAYGKDGKLRIRKRTNGYFSPGHFYMIVTDYLGFIPGRHEGKVMGLAAHGNPEKAYPAMQKVISYRPGKLDFIAGPVAEEFFEVIRSPPGTRTREWYAQDTWGDSGAEIIETEVKNVGLTYFQKVWADFSPEDIAAAAQKRFEDVILEFIKDAVNLIGCSNLAVAGGVFANVQLNQKIIELPEVENLYIHPNMSDGGLAVGAALLLYHKKALNQGAVYRHRPWRDVYLGPNYSVERIEKVLRESGLQWEQPEDLVSKISHALVDGRVIGLFQGQMEYGPRALGNRSILADATEVAMHDSLNERLNRTEIMPFAPAILEENAKEWFPRWSPTHVASWYMTMTYHIAPDLALKVPAIVHLDGTARPQVVKKSINPTLHDILAKYKQLTEIPLVINTSFNMHEEPIVCTPEDAIDSFSRGAADILIMENCWIDGQYQAATLLPKQI